MKAVITLPYEKGIITFLKGEDKELLNKRAKLDIKKKNNKVYIDIEAKDSVALRAMTNVALRSLVVWEKIGEKNERKNK